MNTLNNLNPKQKQAVTTTEGPLLVLAGAGTGKTTVLTSRFYYLIKQQLARPYEILAITFTNKAALEMKERILALLRKENSINEAELTNLWCGTFHSIGLRMLRQFHSQVGLKPRFSILDTTETQNVIKEILTELNLDPKLIPIKRVANSIALLKDKIIFADEVNKVSLYADEVLTANKLVKIYQFYSNKLKELNAVDFNDLLLLCIKLFKDNPEILSYYQNKFKYILVDEYQDTNAVQESIVAQLALPQNNICCVGDDDQSIYSWRGAEITNILNFAQRYKNATVIRLEQNYRSTLPILNTAHAIISRNTARWGKQLQPIKEEGEKIIVHKCVDSPSEASLICEEINRYLRDGYNYNEIAVLVRAGHQTRELESAFVKNNIDYRLVGSFKFFERLEIKDALAYLKLCYDPNNDISLSRVINVPKRGVGNKAIETLKEVVRSNSCSIFQALDIALKANLFKGKIHNVLDNLYQQIVKWNSFIPTKDLPELAELIMHESGYIEMLEFENTLEARSRIENLMELINSLYEYSNLEEYLDHICLMTSKSDNNSHNAVSVMTLHAAKGLEFHVVFLPGWEEGIFPSAKVFNEDYKQIEEERRLAYVGITRAKEHLVITHCDRRSVFGKWEERIPSRFLKEMDSQYLHLKNQGHYSDEVFARPIKTSLGGFPSFGRGAIVYHNMYGSGVVIKQTGNNVEVEFEAGVHTIRSDFLQRVNY